MSGKVKMRCGRCGKPFKSTGARQVFCPECAAKERAARQAQKSTPTPTSVAPATAAPKITGPGANILGATPTIVTTSVPPDSGLFGAAARASDRTSHGTSEAASGQSHATSHGAGHTQSGTHAEHVSPPPQHPGERAAGGHGGEAHGGKHGQHGQQGHGAHATKVATAPAKPRAPREPRPAPFTLTDEVRQRIEARYLELATPVEFDGIRTQIAQELTVPKGAVKRVVSELRERMQLPSWWELQAYRGSEGDLERIRAAYTPLLPLPPVGVHKQIAESLGLDPVLVYQGIRRVRAEMRLPQYNPPEAHAEQTAEHPVTSATGTPPASGGSHA